MFTRSRILRFVLLPLALVGSLGATAAFAGPFGPGGGPGGPGLHHILGGERLEMLAEELGLSADQTEQIRTILEDARARGEELRAEHEGIREEAIALFSAAELDHKAIEKHRQKTLDLADAGSAIAVDTMTAVAEVLTPEQRVALADKAESFHAEGGWRERMRSRWHGERGDRSPRGDFGGR